MPGYDTNFGAKRARGAREHLGLDADAPVACVLTLVEQRAGLPVVVGCLPEHVAGALWRDGADAIVWVNGVQAVERQRFTLAHELGHVYCRHEATAVDTTEIISGRTQVPREVQANAFAAELLAPRAGVEPLVEREPGLDDIVKLAAHFGISTIAALYRCRTLGLASSRRYEQLHDEIEDGLHRAVWDYLKPARVSDVLAGLDEHPRLPETLAGSALAALLRGETTPTAAAQAAGCSAETLAGAVAGLAR
jgi:Zn-dependent peptidase ImmA (M78 family)